MFRKRIYRRADAMCNRFKVGCLCGERGGDRVCVCVGRCRSGVGVGGLSRVVVGYGGGRMRLGSFYGELGWGVCF